MHATHSSFEGSQSLSGKRESTNILLNATCNKTLSPLTSGRLHARHLVLVALTAAWYISRARQQGIALSCDVQQSFSALQMVMMIGARFDQCFGDAVSLVCTTQ